MASATATLQHRGGQEDMIVDIALDLTAAQARTA